MLAQLGSDVSRGTPAPIIAQGGLMSDHANPAQPRAQDEGGSVPVMQQVLDNPFLLLFLGVAIPTVFYIVWGVMEIVTIPIAK
jgi:hypothetical protein